MCARSEKDPKFVYYLSAEFLMGRSLMNAIQNLELTGTLLQTHSSYILLLYPCPAPPEGKTGCRHPAANHQCRLSNAQDIDLG